MICFLSPAPFDVINLIHIGWTAPNVSSVRKGNLKALDQDLSSVQIKPKADFSGYSKHSKIEFLPRYSGVFCNLVLVVLLCISVYMYD